MKIPTDRIGYSPTEKERENKVVANPKKHGFAKFDRYTQKKLIACFLLNDYEENIYVGGPLHNIIEGGNYEYSAAAHAYKYATEEGDYVAGTIARLMADMSMDDRKQLVERRWEIYQLLYEEL